MRAQCQQVHSHNNKERGRPWLKKLKEKVKKEKVVSMTRKETLQKHIEKMAELKLILKKSQEDIQEWEKMFAAWLENELGVKGKQLTLPEILAKWSELDSD